MLMSDKKRPLIVVRENLKIKIIKGEEIYG